MSAPVRLDAIPRVDVPSDRLIPRRRRVWPWAVGAALLLAVGAAIGLSSRGSSGARVVKPERRTLQRVIHAPGRVEPVKAAVKVVTRAPGILKSVQVAESQHVGAGEVVAVVEDDEARAQLKLAQAELESSRASERRLAAGARAEELAQARARLDEAEDLRAASVQTRLRTEALYASKAVTLAAQDDAVQAEKQATHRAVEAKKAYDLLASGARADERRAAAASVEAAEAKLALAQLQVEQRQLRAPFSGTVLAIFAHPGDALGPFMPVAQIADLSAFQVRAEVDELSMGSLRDGQRACTRAEAFPTLEVCGQVTWIGSALGRRHFEDGNAGGQVQDLRVVELTASLPAGDARLVAGMGVELQVETTSPPNALVVPMAAVRDHDGKSWVRLAQGDRQERQIDVGTNDGLFYEVTRGLSEADVVVVER